MKKIYLISNGTQKAYVAAENMNAALYLLKDEEKGVPSFELSLETEPAEGEEAGESTPIEISESEATAIEKVAREEAVKVYAKKLSNGKIILVPVTEVADIEATIAKEDQEIQSVYEYSSSAYLVR